MSEWISVEDRLPEPDQEVLLNVCFQRHNGGAYVETNEMITGGYEVVDENERNWFVGNQSMIWDYHFNIAFAEDDITHWMPLPEPPK